MTAATLFIRTVIARDFRFLAVTLLACAVAAIVATFQFSVYASFVRSAGVMPRALGGDFWITAASVECFDFPNPIAEDYGAMLARIAPDARFRRVAFGFATWRSPTGQRGNVALVGADGLGLPASGILVDRSDVARLDLDGAAGRLPASISDRTVYLHDTVDDLPTFLGAPYVMMNFEDARELLGMDPTSSSYLIVDLPAGATPDPARLLSAGQRFSDIGILSTEQFSASSARYWQNKTGAGLAILLAAVLAAFLMAILLTNGVLRFIQRYQQDLLSMMGHGADQGEITRIIAGIAALIALATGVAALLTTPLLIALFQPLLPWTAFRLGDALAPFAAVLAALAVALLGARKSISAFGPEAVFRS